MLGGNVIQSPVMFKGTVGSGQSATKLLRCTIHTDGTLRTAGAAKCSGVFDATAAAGEEVAVVDRKSPGVIRMIAAGAITKGSTVYAATGGKVTDSNSGSPPTEGVAMSTTTADNDEILVLAAA